MDFVVRVERIELRKSQVLHQKTNACVCLRMKMASALANVSKASLLWVASAGIVQKDMDAMVILVV